MLVSENLGSNPASATHEQDDTKTVPQPLCASASLSVKWRSYCLLLRVVVKLRYSKGYILGVPRF